MTQEYSERYGIGVMRHRYSVRLRVAFEILSAVLFTTSVSSSLPVLERTPAGSLHPAGIGLVSKKLLEYNNKFLEIRKDYVHVQAMCTRPFFLVPPVHN